MEITVVRKLALFLIGFLLAISPMVTYSQINKSYSEIVFDEDTDNEEEEPECE